MPAGINALAVLARIFLGEFVPRFVIHALFVHNARNTFAAVRFCRDGRGVIRQHHECVILARFVKALFDITDDFFIDKLKTARFSRCVALVSALVGRFKMNVNKVVSAA